MVQVPVYRRRGLKSIELPSLIPAVRLWESWRDGMQLGPDWVLLSYWGLGVRASGDANSQRATVFRDGDTSGSIENDRTANRSKRLNEAAQAKG